MRGKLKNQSAGEADTSHASNRSDTDDRNGPEEFVAKQERSIVVDIPEGFLAIDGFPGYAVGPSGSVISRRKGSWKPMKPILKKHGYMQVVLSRGDEQHTRLVHRLVLEAFVGPAPSEHECCHDDGNRTNNAISNLRWDTRKNNQSDIERHGTRNAPRGERSGSAKLTEEQVREVFRLRKSGLLQKEIAKRLGVIRQTIGLILSGKNWPHIFEEQS
jgi:hypothetical protein